MKIVIAPQGFKGSLKAHEAAQAMAEGVKAAGKRIEAVLLPIADGGAGTVRALVEGTKGKTFSANVHGPLGEMVNADWGLSGDGTTAFIEVAAASGLSLVPPNKLDPMWASTYGTGELILKALEKPSVARVIIGLGDSATVDGGTGIASALGLKFLDDDGKPIPPGDGGLAALKHIDVSGRSPLVEGRQILAACDVTNPLYGPQGAAYVYGPQKGATPEMVKQLDANLRNLDAVIKKDLGLDMADMPGAGAAGGLGAGLTAFLGASLRSGIGLICDVIGFDSYVKTADLVLTGEGRMDYQTAYGKTAVGIARRAKAFKKPVIALCGSLGQGYEEVYKLGIDKAVAISPPSMPLEEAMKNAAGLLQAATEKVVREWAEG